MSLSLDLIPENDINLLLNKYNLETKEQLLELIISGKIAESPDSVIDWIIANNLLVDKIKIPVYKQSDILLASQNKLIQIAKLLQLDFVDQNNIIRILTYLNKLQDDSNYFTSLPEEILIQIIKDLPCRSLLNLIKTYPKLAAIINKYDLINKAKMRGFPRKDGHCHNHDVKKFVDSLDNDIVFYPNKMLSLILDHLYQINVDLVRGDLIFIDGIKTYRNNGIYIFDGCQIVFLDYTIDDYGSLPKEFKVINNGVPIDYWISKKENGLKTMRGIEHNRIMWFDPSSVRQQLINNVKVEEIGEYGSRIDLEISTTFIYNKKLYTILYDSKNPDAFKFINILKTKDLLMFNNDENEEYYKNNILILPDQ
jgi:hypothetical protein